MLKQIKNNQTKETHRK